MLNSMSIKIKNIDKKHPQIIYKKRRKNFFFFKYLISTKKLSN